MSLIHFEGFSEFSLFFFFFFGGGDEGGGERKGLLCSEMLNKDGISRKKKKKCITDYGLKPHSFSYSARGKFKY